MKTALIIIIVAIIAFLIGRNVYLSKHCKWVISRSDHYDAILNGLKWFCWWLVLACGFIYGLLPYIS